MNRERLAHAKKVGFEPIDLSAHDRLGELVADVLGAPEVDNAIDCVGFEAKGQGSDGQVIEAPAVVLNSLMEITRPAGSIGIPGLYVTDDPGAKEQAAQQGMLSLRFGLGWAKSHILHTGQSPVLKYNRQLMQAILWDRLPIGEIVDVQVIPLDQAPEGYRNFDAGVPNKFVIDPHGMVPKTVQQRLENNVVITLSDARRVIAAAETKAHEIGQLMNIAVVDTGRNLVSHVRMDGAWIGSIDISIDKAFTARAFDTETAQLAKNSQPGLQFFGIDASNHGRVMIFAGGVPLRRGGAVIGAIGVSGGDGNQDQMLAAAGAAMFN